MSNVTTLTDQARQRLGSLFLRGSALFRSWRPAVSRLLGRDTASAWSSGKPAELSEQAAVREVCARLLLALETGPPPEEKGGAAGTNAGGHRGVFVFSSPARKQGTSSVAVAVAGLLARSGKRTVLAVAAPTGVPDPGGSTTLRESLGARDAIPFDDPPLLRLQVPDSFLELPEEARAPHRWVREFDVMIVDAPAMPEFVTRYWVPLAQAVVLVVDGEKTSVRAVAEVRDEITLLGGTLAGVVLNRYRSRVPSFLHG